MLLCSGVVLAGCGGDSGAGGGGSDALPARGPTATVEEYWSLAREAVESDTSSLIPQACMLWATADRAGCEEDFPGFFPTDEEGELEYPAANDQVLISDTLACVSVSWGNTEADGTSYEDEDSGTDAYYLIRDGDDWALPGDKAQRKVDAELERRFGDFDETQEDLASQGKVCDD